MYFFKRNFKTIILYVLALGITGTVIAYFMAGNTYDYEEYYSLSEPLSTTQQDELSIQLNQQVNSELDDRAATIGYSSESQYLSLNIDSMSAGDVSDIKKQFDAILDDMDVGYEEGIDITVDTNSNIIAKILIIAASIIVGFIFGVIHGLQNRRITSDEDIKYYLNEKTLGTF